MPTWYQTVNRFEDPVGAARIATFIDILSRFPKGHLVDLGAGHGVFSLIAAELGWRVTAVDVRSVRFPENTDVHWVVSDVRDFDQYDDVDVVACLGLWYHLSLDDQKALAARIAPRPLILDTHVALADDVQGTRDLTGPVIAQQGFTGRYYDESELQDQPTASWGNLASFWPSLPSLERQMYGAGFDVFERYEPAYLFDRGFFVARSFGDEAARAAFDSQVERFSPVKDLGASPVGSHRSLTAELSLASDSTKSLPAGPATASEGTAGPSVLPIRAAVGQLATAALASGRRKVRQARKARNRRSS